MCLSFFACVAVVVVASSWSGRFFNSGAGEETKSTTLFAVAAELVTLVALVSSVPLVSFLTRKKAAKGLVAINARGYGGV